MIDRPLPQALEAERSILGACLVDPHVIHTVGADLAAEHFYRDAHRRIFAALVRLAEQGVGLDFVTLTNELQRAGDLDAVGGPAYVAALGDGMPRSTNVEYYAKIVREKATLRGIIAVGATLTVNAYEASESAGDVLDEAEAALLALAMDDAAGDLTLIEAGLAATMAQLAAIQDGGDPVTGLSTGFPTLDDYTRGFHPGHVIVIAARPAEGKSSLALQIARHMARTVPVGFFGMEMPRDELIGRLIAQEAQVSFHTMMQGRLTPSEQREVGGACAALSAVPLAIDETAALSAFHVRMKAKKMRARRGIGALVVDYLQLMEWPRGVKSREEAVGSNCRSLKILAQEMKIPVIVVSQLNRKPEDRADKRPTLADLRESGAIEQHANEVFLIYRPPAEGVRTLYDAELLIAKQRNGPAHLAIEMTYNGPQFAFRERVGSAAYV